MANALQVISAVACAVMAWGGYIIFHNNESPRGEFGNYEFGRMLIVAGLVVLVLSWATNQFLRRKGNL